jgi:hypothetical protein
MIHESKPWLTSEDFYKYTKYTSKQLREMLLSIERELGMTFDQKYAEFEKIAKSRTWDLIGCSYILRKPTNLLCISTRWDRRQPTIATFYEPSVDKNLPTILLVEEPWR